MEMEQNRHNGEVRAVWCSLYSAALSLTIIDGYAKVPLWATDEAQQAHAKPKVVAPSEHSGAVLLLSHERLLNGLALMYLSSSWRVLSVLGDSQGRVVVA